MGIWQPAYLASSGDVVIQYPAVLSHVDSASLKSADLTVVSGLRNLTSQSVSGTLRGQIGNVSFSKPVTIGANDSALVSITPSDAPQLRFTNPRLWWPVELGSPELYTLNLEFVSNGRVSDRQSQRFGIREVTSESTPKGGRLFRVNGKRILIRGGGWAPDMFFRPQPERQDAQMKYALDMHLNTLRLEGNYENDRFFHQADSLGVLVMTGWVCCSPWEEWPKWKPEQHQIAAASLRDQMRRLRGHPSVFTWLNGSDNPPPADVEQMYLNIERDELWPNPTISSASAKPAAFSGASGVKMTGPYDWVPPGYWMQDSTHGGAWAYNTETSPGAAVPPIAEDYTVTSQLMTYEGERAMFEAYRRNKYVSTGVIQWMFNNAWPSIYWHLFDWYLLPGGGYFGTKRANEPVHAVYSYDDRTIAVVNDNKPRSPVHGARLRTRILDLDASEKFSKDTTIDIPADSTLRVFALPQPTNLATPAYFVDLRLTGADGRPISSNFYWLSTKMDALSDSSTWYMTPVKNYADFTALRGMPQSAVSVSARSSRSGGTGTTTVTLRNPTKAIALFTRLQVVGRGGEETLPVFWEDNYVTLLPGESRTLTARYNVRDLGGASPRVVVTGWNIHRATTR
nr:MAG: hypothetical protein AUG74_17295 [Bacteroidetes bacterium 13_1_20CM_4_60_6]